APKEVGKEQPTSERVAPKAPLGSDFSQRRPDHSKMRSSPITRNAVMRHLAAMACQSFEVGVLRPNGRMLLREWTAEQIDRAVGWLRRENARGAHIYIRPYGAHALSLVDDLSVDSLKRMKESGFEPALVVETSPANFQTWLKHGRVLDCPLSTHAAKELARRFGGHQAPTGDTSDGWRGSPIRNQDGGSSRGCRPLCSC